MSANFSGSGGRPSTTLGVRKLESLGYHVALFRYPTFSRFDTIPVCDTHAHRHANAMMANMHHHHYLIVK